MLVFLPFFALGDSEPTKLELGKPQNLSMSESLDELYFQYSIPDNADTDLSIEVVPKDPSSSASIYASFTNPSPNSLDSTYYANAFGFNIIDIPKTALQGKKTLYIGVVCTTPVCSLTLQIDKTGEAFVRANSQINLDFANYHEQIVHASIPLDGEITHILINIGIRNVFDLTKPIHAYIKKGNEIPTSKNYDVVAIPSWKDGVTGAIYGGDSAFCIGCNYTILIEAEPKARLTVEVRAVGNITNMALGQIVDDAVEPLDTANYAIEVSGLNDQDYIYVHFNVFEGLAMVYLHPESLPQFAEDYKWNMTGYSWSKFVITPEDRRAAGLNNKLYIRVIGFFYTTYELRAYTATQQGGLLWYGVSENAFVYSDELINYYLVGPAEDNSNRNISLVLDFWFGQGNLYLKSCTNLNDCKTTKDEIKKIAKGELSLNSTAYPMRIVSNITYGYQGINFVHHSSQCPKVNFGTSIDPWYLCVYSVAVEGLDTYTTNLTHYQLTASIDQDVNPTREGVSNRFTLMDQEHIYYQFTLTNDTDVEAVNFMLTSVSGIAYMYVSTKIKYPNEMSSSADIINSIAKEGKISIKRQDGSSLRGTYYIGIYALTSCSFIMTPIIQRKQNNSRSIIPLMPGKVQRDDITGDEIAYYSFKFSNSSDVEIFLTPVTGKVSFYIEESGKPLTRAQYKWSCSNETLTINRTELQMGVEYMIAVFPEPGVGGKMLPEYSYKISYQYIGSPIHIEVGAPYSSVFNSAMSRTLVFDYFQGEGDVIIMKYPTTSELVMSIGIGPLNPNPSANNSYYTTAGKNESILVNLTAQTLEIECKFTGQSGYRCPVYLNLASTSSAFYLFSTLLVYKSGHPNKLTDGSTSVYPALEEKPVHVYYFPKDTNTNVTLISNSYWSDVDFFVNLVQVKNSQSAFVDLSQYPTKEKFAFSSSDILKRDYTYSFFDELVIDTASLKQCNRDPQYTCAILISAYSAKYQNDTDNYYPRPYFTMSATSELVPLEEGVPITASITVQDSYKYYYFKARKPNSTIFISCTPLTEKKPSLLVSLGAEMRPHFDMQNWDFMSDWFNVDVQISPEDMEAKFKDKLTTDGDWVIAVHSYEPTSYHLVVYYIDSHIIRLTEGVPFELEMQQNTTRYFSFNTYYESGFTLRFMPQFGSVDIYVTSIFQNQTERDFLPTPSAHYWSTDLANTRNRIDIKSSDNHFCSMCRYLIAVTSSTKTIKGSFVITYNNSWIILQEGKPNYMQISNNEESRFRFYRYEGENFDLDFVAFAGTITAMVTNSLNPGANGILAKGTNNGPFMKLTVASSSNWVNYLIIVCNSPTANFSVTLAGNSAEKYLSDSHITYGMLNPQKATKYLFYNPYENSRQAAAVQAIGHSYKFRIMVNVYNDDYTKMMLKNRKDVYDLPNVTVTEVSQIYSSTGKLVSKVDLPPLRNYSTYQGLNSNVRATETLIIDYKNESLISMNGKEGSNHLEIVFENPSDHPITYSVIVKTNDITPLPLNTPILSRTLVDDYEIFEISSYSEGLLVIEVFECFGKVSFAATTSLENLKKSHFDIEVHRTSETLYGQLKIGIGVVYVKVTALDGVADDDKNPLKEAMYKIQARIFGKHEPLPYNLFFAGMNGNMEYEFDMGDQRMDLFWRGLSADEEMLEKAFQIYNVSVRYKLVLNTDPIVNEAVSKCSVLPWNFGGVFRNKTFDEQIFLSRLNTYDSIESFRNRSEIDFRASFILPDEPLDFYATLMAIAEGVQGNDSVLWELPIFYKSSEIKYEGRKTGLFALVLIVFIGLAVAGLAGGLVYFYKKYKLTKKRLTFEMQDIKNIAEGVNVDVDRELPKEITEKVEKKSKERYLGLNEEHQL